MINAKVHVLITVQVESQSYGDDRPLSTMFRSIASDAVNQVRRELGPHATIVGDPRVIAILTEPRELSVPAPPKEPA